MFPRYHRKLADQLRQALNMNKARADCFAMNKARADCFAACTLGAITAKSVRLTEMTARIPGKALPDSKFRRLQYFFNDLRPDYNALARFIMHMLRDVTGDQPLTLAIDRTNWEARENEVNLLVLSVCLGDAAQPLLWTDLGRDGNSNTKQRIRLVRRFLSVMGRERFGCLVADREFVGEDWFDWLLRERLPFVLRLRENMKTTPWEGRPRDARDYFTDLRPGECRDLGPCDLCHVTMGFFGLRLRDGELLILGYSGLCGHEVGAKFMERWNIETGFEKLKSHGFDMESSRLRGGGKAERLLAILAVGFAWCYAMGIWSIQTISPIRLIRKLGRRARSVFGRGLEFLCGLVHGSSCPCLRRASGKAFAVLRPTRLRSF